MRSIRLRSKLPMVWRDKIPWNVEFHFSPPDVSPPHFMHHPVKIPSEHEYPLYDRGRVVIGLRNGCYQFHPLEWSPDPLKDANPWCRIPFDKRRRRFAEKVRQQFTLEMGEAASYLMRSGGHIRKVLFS